MKSELATVQEWPVGDISRTPRVNAAQVYLAKHRVGAVLKREVKLLEATMDQRSVVHSVWKLRYP